MQRVFSPIKKLGRLMSSSSSSKLIIFDKDGTLLSFEKPWLAWCNRLQTELADATTTIVKQDLTDHLKSMGVDMDQGRMSLGTFAECSQEQVRAEIVEGFKNSLHQIGDKQDAIYEIIDSCRKEGDGKFPLTDLPLLFSELKARGYLIAIATADCHKGVNMFLSENSVMVDFVMSASNTQEFPPKPSGYSADKICECLNVEPRNVVMVGDTPTDAMFGVNGDYGLVVGVTTGIGKEAELKEAGCDVILHDLRDLVSLLDEKMENNKMDN